MGTADKKFILELPLKVILTEEGTSNFISNNKKLLSKIPGVNRIPVFLVNKAVITSKKGNIINNNFILNTLFIC